MDGNNMNQYDNYSYEATNTYEEAEGKGGNGLAIASLICSIASIVCCCGGGPLAIAGIICGAMGIKKCEKVGMARAGLIISIISMVIAIIVGIVMGILTSLGYFAGSGFGY